MDSPRSVAWCSPRGWAATARSAARSAPMRSSRSGPPSPCTPPEPSRPSRTIPYLAIRTGETMTTTANAATSDGDQASTAQPAIDIPGFVTVIDHDRRLAPGVHLGPGGTVMNGQLGVIYMLHFDPPYRHARHYVGWTDDLLDRKSTRLNS